MIDKSCFTKGWIDAKSSELNYPDKNLLEKLFELLLCSTCWRVPDVPFISREVVA